MKHISYIIWQEDKYYVSKCLNVEVSSFGDTMDEARQNLKEAVELYFEDEKEIKFFPIDNVFLGKEIVNA